MTTAPASQPPGPGLDPATSSAPAADPAAALADAAEAWLPLLVPPGFTPPAAALLILAAGTTICLGGGRHLRLLLALGGGALAGFLAAGLVPTAADRGDVLLPVAGCTVAGSLVAAAAARLLATAVLALSLGIAAPATVAAWDTMAAPHLRPLAASAGTGTTAAIPPSTAGDAGAVTGRAAGVGSVEAPRHGAVTATAAPATDAAARAEDPGPTAAPPRLGPAVLGLAASAADPGPRDETSAAIAGAAALARADRLARLALDFGAAGGLDAAVARAGRRLRAFAGRHETVDGRSIPGPAPSHPVRVASRDASPPGAPRDPTMLLLAIGGIASGVGLGLTRTELAARAATASVGAMLVILGGLHLPEGLVAGGWIGPTRPEPVLLAWIALAILGATLQWRYRPPLADIGR